MDEAALNVDHLFRRAGFGALKTEVDRYKGWAWDDLVDLVLETNAPATGRLPDTSDDRGYYERWVDMVHYWLDRARRPVNQAPIQEKMVLFWHGLLCSSLDKIHNHRNLMEQNHLFRTHALGNYDVLLHKAAKGAALLEYLDNDLNVVGEPNENFARELMELFVLGVGNYSEQDVRESARAWTGYGIDKDKRYAYDGDAHDNGNKTFMGEAGNLNGPQVIDIMLRKKRNEHSRFMSRKLWSFFAYPVSVTDQVVTDIAATYSQSFDIKATLRAIFTHSQFRSLQARRGLVRSPIEYVVAVMRHTNTSCAQLHPEWFLSGMGQRPFYPPNVSGWRQNDYWISSSASWAKMHLASSIRWHMYKRDDIEDVNEVTKYNPLTFKYTPEQSVSRAVASFQLVDVNDASQQQLINYVKRERASDHRWTERAGLLMLPLLLPEMQMA